jgi:hypothetical protein
MAIITDQQRRADGRAVVTVSGERYTHPQVVTERGAETDPGYLSMLDIAANHEARRMAGPVRSARQRSTEE